MIRMEKPLSKTEVIQLCSELIRNTEHATNYAKYIGKTTTENDPITIIPGNRWYTDFMKRNSDKFQLSTTTGTTTALNIMESNQSSTTLLHTPCSSKQDEVTPEKLFYVTKTSIYIHQRGLQDMENVMDQILAQLAQDPDRIRRINEQHQRAT